jgi:hypothetical protein
MDPKRHELKAIRPPWSHDQGLRKTRSLLSVFICVYPWLIRNWLFGTPRITNNE